MQSDINPTTDKIISKRNIILFVCLIISAILAEIFIFNYRHWISVSNEPQTVRPYWIGEGLVENNDGTYTVGEGSYNIAFHAEDMLLRSLYIDILHTDTDRAHCEAISTDILATDEGHCEFYTLGNREIFNGEEISKYTLVKLYGRAGDIILSPKAKPGDKIYAGLILNPVIPLHLSLSRMLYVFLILMLIWALRPSSRLYDIGWLKLSKKARITVSSLFSVIVIVLLAAVLFASTGYHRETTPQEDQYQKLAEALSQGSLSLLEPVDKRLVNLDNPYDPMLRYSAFKEDSAEYRWDNAYRDGKYYVYFGVIPVLLFYLPVYLITGMHIHNFTVCLILLILLITGYMLLLNELIKKYNRECSLGLWLISSILLCAGSFVLYAASRPDHYNVPILNALVFGVWGMWAFLRSDSDENGRLNMKYLFIGSLFTALITGCRPQLFIFLLLDLLILKKYVFSIKYLRSKDGLSSIICFFTPMVLVAAFIMAYNFLRFGSVIDFGASYNLTLEDLIHRGFDVRRGIVGVIAIILSPVRHAGTYPFIEYSIFPTSFMGQITQTATPGGLFAVTPLSILSLLSPVYMIRRQTRRDSLSLLAFTALISALIICILDTARAGVFERYYMDVATLLSISALFILWHIIKTNKNTAPGIRAAFLSVMIMIIVYEIIFFTLSFMLVEDNGFINARPDLFYHNKYLWEFYL